MNFSERLNIDFSRSLTIVREERCSENPSENSKRLSRALKAKFKENNQDFLDEHKLVDVNFEVFFKNGKPYIRGFFLIHQDGTVEHSILPSPKRYKMYGGGNTIATTLRKVGLQLIRNLPIGKLGAVAVLLVGMVALISSLSDQSGFSKPGGAILFLMGIISAFLFWMSDNGEQG